MQKPSLLRVAASVLILFIIVAALGAYTRYALILSCDVGAVNQASAFLVRQRDSFDHSYQFATSATQEAIVRPVAELQQILMDTLEYSVPDCMRTGKNELIRYMGAVVRAFLAYEAGAAPAGRVRLRAVHDVHIVQRYRACLEFDIARARDVEARILEHIIQHEILAIADHVTEFSGAMRTRDDAHAAVAEIDVVERDPRRDGGARSDRPVLAILVPWDFKSCLRGFTEERRCPHHNIRTDQRFDEIK
jgi:hypothetical protein